MSTRYQAPIIKKTFRILTYIARQRQGVGISELARELAISKSTVHGIVSGLEELGAVRRDPRNKRFSPGLTLLELGGAAYARIDIKDAARPAMEELMETSRESVFLGVRHGDHVTIVDMVESVHQLKISAPVGTTLPLLAGAIGKVFLSRLSQDRASEMLRSQEMVRYTDRTITDQTLFLEQVSQARINGYACDDEEYLAGVRAVAAPIANNGHTPAAVWVVGFKASLNRAKVEILCRQTKAAAEAIGRRLVHPIG